MQQDGESGIMVYKGANAMLTSEELIESKDAFDRAEYCLLSTELDNEAIETAAQLAWEREVKIVIKPAALDRISDELLKRPLSSCQIPKRAPAFAQGSPR